MWSSDVNAFALFIRRFLFLSRSVSFGRIWLPEKSAGTMRPLHLSLSLAGSCFCSCSVFSLYNLLVRDALSTFKMVSTILTAHEYNNKNNNIHLLSPRNFMRHTVTQAHWNLYVQSKAIAKHLLLLRANTHTHRVDATAWKEMRWGATRQRQRKKKQLTAPGEGEKKSACETVGTTPNGVKKTRRHVGYRVPTTQTEN